MHTLKVDLDDETYFKLIKHKAELKAMSWKDYFSTLLSDD